MLAPSAVIRASVVRTAVTGRNAHARYAMNDCSGRACAALLGKMSVVTRSGGAADSDLQRQSGINPLPAPVGWLLLGGGSRPGDPLLTSRISAPASSTLVK